MEPKFESIQTDIQSSFRCLRFSCESFSTDHTWHYHPEFELTWIIESEGSRFIGDSIQRYSRGDLVLVGPDMPHCWHDDPLSSSSGGPRLIVVQFRSDCFGGDFFSLQEARDASTLLKDAALGLAFPAETANHVGAVLEELADSTGLHRMARFLDVIDILSRSPRTVLATPEFLIGNDVNPVNRERVDLVHRYVREHLSGDISQAEIADALGMNAPAFSRFFKLATGKTFVAFVNTLRVHEACRMLSSTDQSITEVAMACGFNNISNFNRQFLAFRGMNPSDFRNHLREREERALKIVP